MLIVLFLAILFKSRPIDELVWNINADDITSFVETRLCDKVIVQSLVEAVLIVLIE